MTDPQPPTETVPAETFVPAAPPTKPNGHSAAGNSAGESERQRRKSSKQDPPQSREWRVAAFVGLWLGALGVAALMAVMWAWAIANRVGQSGEVVRWIGPDFNVTVATSALVLAAVGGVTGSVVHSASVFSARVGQRTFEASYLWWYLLRPFEAALLAVVFVAAMRSGLVALGTQGGDSATTVLIFLAGGLAGLFTDRVLQQLRGLLGATKTDERASEQPAPEKYAAVSPTI